MRVGILTFHCARNYGAVLQAYALQTYLEKQGHQVYVIDYRPSYLVFPYRLLKFDIWRDKGFITGLKWNIRELLIAPIRGLRNYRFERFVRRRLHLRRLTLPSRVQISILFSSEVTRYGILIYVRDSTSIIWLTQKSLEGRSV